MPKESNDKGVLLIKNWNRSTSRIINRGRATCFFLKMAEIYLGTNTIVRRAQRVRIR